MTITYGRPGVSVTEVLVPRETGSVAGGASRAVLIADLDRGPMTAVTVSSWSEFRQVFGDWSDNAPVQVFGHTRNASVDAAYLYFANNAVGGTPLTVLRVVNTDAILAQANLVNDVGATLFTIKAISPGTWGNRLRVAVLGQFNESGQFDAGDFSGEFSIPSDFGNGNLEVIVDLMDRYGVYQTVERFPALTGSAGDRRYLEYVVNGSSSYINITANTAGGLSNAAAVRQVSLAGGESGGTPPVLSDVLHQLDFFDSALTISYSGHWDTTDLAEVTNYCSTRGDSFHIIDTPDLGSGISDALEWVEPLDGSFAAVYYPPLTINDPSAGPNHIRRSAPAGGAVLGVFSTNDAMFGLWKSPAGVVANVKGIIGPAYRFTNPQLDQLNGAVHPINPIRVINGVGPCIMGARTLNQSQADRYIGVRRSFSYLRSRLQALTEFAVFEVNGPDLWNTIDVRLSNFLGLYFQQGALRGARESEAFYVTCDASNNTRTTMAAGEVHVEVGVAIEYPAEFIIIKLTHNQTSVRVE